MSETPEKRGPGYQWAGDDLHVAGAFGPGPRVATLADFPVLAAGERHYARRREAIYGVDEGAGLLIERQEQRAAAQAALEAL